MAALVFGLCFNLFTLWMIAQHTPKEMRVYSILLIQTCIVDLILLALSYIVQAVGIFFLSKIVVKIINKINIFGV
jgi:hypothetical protein